MRLRFLVSPLLALGAAAAASARAAEPGSLSADTVTTACALRDRVAAGSRASEWVREITERAGLPKDLDRAAAAAAVTAWCVAEAPAPLERVPADKRKLAW